MIVWEYCELHVIRELHFWSFTSHLRCDRNVLNMAYCFICFYKYMQVIEEVSEYRLTIQCPLVLCVELVAIVSYCSLVQRAISSGPYARRLGSFRWSRYTSTLFASSVDLLGASCSLHSGQEAC